MNINSNAQRRGRIRHVVLTLLALAGLLGASIFAVEPAAAQQSDLDRLAELLPHDAADRFDELHHDLGIHSDWEEAVRNAIDPDDYVCEQSELSLWIGDLFAPLDPATLDVLFMAGAPFWSGDATVLFDNDPSDTYIGTDGSETKEQIKRHRTNLRFWDVDTQSVQLHGMHGAQITDDPTMVQLLMFVLGVPPELAQEIVDLVQAIIENDPILDFDHPLFSLNAFAIGALDIPGLEPSPPKIVMGDGILEALAGIGLATNGPDFVHAHEFAHQVQFALDAVPPYGDPEQDRRTELMADALGAYFAAHPRGASFQNKRVVDLALSSGSVGDCGFDQPGHHGTPNQRAAAAEWGAALATDTRPRGKIRSASEMIALFDEQLPILVAPDAG